MYRNATNVIAHYLAFARVQPGSKVDAERLSTVAQCQRAANRARRTVQGDEETVTRRLDLATVESRDFAPYKGVVAIE